MAMTGIKLILLLFSNYGYASLLKSKFNCNKYLAWILSVCIIILLLYLSSLINLLAFFGLLLPRLGIILGVYFSIYNWKRAKVLIKPFNIITLFFIIYFIILGSTLLFTRFVHYDNFSHWAIIVKYLFTQQALPDIHSEIINFASYPIGTSLWCYYFVNFVGFTDGIMLFAQFYLILSCLYAMIAVIKDKERILEFAIMFTIITLFNYFNIAIRMNNLLVDFVLPLITLAAMSSIYINKKNMKTMLVNTIILVGMLGIVKNNGIFFVALVLCYFIINVFQYIDQKWTILTKIIVIFGTVVASLLPYLLWIWHIKYTFGNQLSKHEVSVTAYRDIYKSKSTNIIIDIIQNFWQHTLKLSTLPSRGVILINILFIVTALVLWIICHKKNNLMRGLLFTNTIIVLYYIGILLMFIFSMPNEEALVLAGFDRYASSIIIFGLGVYAFFAVISIDNMFYEQNINKRNLYAFKNIKNKHIYQYSIVLFLFISVLLMLSENNGIKYNSEQYRDSVPYKMEKVVGNDTILNHRKYLIVTRDKSQVDNYFTQYVGKYYLYSNHVDAIEDISQLSKAQFIDLIKGYDVIVVIDKHYTFKVMSKKYLHITTKVEKYSSNFLLKNIYKK